MIEKNKNKGRVGVALIDDDGKWKKKLWGWPDLARGNVSRARGVAGGR